MKLQRSGFTLIEVLLVILLMAILSAITVVKLAGVKSRNEVKDVVQEIAFFDGLVRQDALRSNHAGMVVFDFNHQRIDRLDAKSQEAHGKSLFLVQGGPRIEQIVVGSEESTTGQVTMPCSVQGITHSYAVAVSAPKNQTQWLVVVGMTGQCRIVGDIQTVRQLLEAGSHANP